MAKIKRARRRCSRSSLAVKRSGIVSMCNSLFRWASSPAYSQGRSATHQLRSAPCRCSSQAAAPSLLHRVLPHTLRQVFQSRASAQMQNGVGHRQHLHMSWEEIADIARTSWPYLRSLVRSYMTLCSFLTHYSDRTSSAPAAPPLHLAPPPLRPHSFLPRSPHSSSPTHPH